MKTLQSVRCSLRSATGFLVSAGLLLVASFNAISVAAATPKSLVVMLDGVRADACRVAKTPNIDSLSNGSWVDGYHGAWTYACHTIKDAPPNSAPNHAAIATGVSAEKSQVKDNNVFADYVRKNASATYKNYMSRLKEKSDSLQTAFLYSWEPDQVLVSDGNTIGQVQGFVGRGERRCCHRASH